MRRDGETIGGIEGETSGLKEKERWGTAIAQRKSEHL